MFAAVAWSRTRLVVITSCKLAESDRAFQNGVELSGWLSGLHMGVLVWNCRNSVVGVAIVTL